MSNFRSASMKSAVRNTAALALLATAMNVTLPAPPSRADVLGGVLGGGLIGGIIGGSRGAVAGAVVGGVAGAVVEDNRRKKGKKASKPRQKGNK